MKRTILDFERFGHIMALLPMYDASGDGVMVLFDDRPMEWQACTMRTELDRCARAFGFAVPRMRANARLLFGRSRRQELPLAFAPYFVLVPYRFRTPRVKGDVTLAYVNFLHIADVRPQHPLVGPHEEAGVSVSFYSGQSIPVRNPYASACQRFREGCTVRDHLVSVINACGPVTLEALAAAV